MNEYKPSATALWQRKYRINTEMMNKCNSILCKEQRKVSTVPRELKYVLYRACMKCKTNWDKTLIHCPCCGQRLRMSARKKTPYAK
jgi:hypothetical protein